MILILKGKGIYSLSFFVLSFSFMDLRRYSHSALKKKVFLFVLPSFIRIFFNVVFKKILSLGIKKRKFFFLYCPRLFVSLSAEKKIMVEFV